MEVFIEAVKKHQCLWNPLDKDYRNGDKKDNAWQRIVNLNLNVRGIEDIRSAKTEWKKLRDNHRDSLKRQKIKTVGTPNTWRYASTMEFLVPHMKSREKSFSATEEFSEETEYDEKCSPATMYLQASHVSEEEEEEDSKLSVQNEITEIARKRKADTDIMQDIEKVCHKREKNAIEYFFESMAETTKSLPTYLQHRVKKEVLEVVCRAEEEMDSCNRNANDI